MKLDKKRNKDATLECDDESCSITFYPNSTIDKNFDLNHAINNIGDKNDIINNSIHKKLPSHNNQKRPFKQVNNTRISKIKLFESGLPTTEDYVRFYFGKR